MALRFLLPLLALIVISATPITVGHLHHHHRRHSPSSLPTPRLTVAHHHRHSPSPIPTPISRPRLSSSALMAAGEDRVLELGRQVLNLILSGAVVNPVMLNVTLFAPENDDLMMSSDSDPFTLPYHLIPQRLTFSDLLRFQTNNRVPTLLPGKSILITNNCRSHYAIDGARVTQPDLFISSSLAVHGIGAILDYTVYGDGLDLLSKPFPALAPQSQLQKISPPPKLEGEPIASCSVCVSGSFLVFSGVFLSCILCFLGCYLSFFLAIPGEPRGVY